jgi:hypothetical protein
MQGKVPIISLGRVFADQMARQEGQAVRLWEKDREDGKVVVDAVKVEAGIAGASAMPAGLSRVVEG